MDRSAGSDAKLGRLAVIEPLPVLVRRWKCPLCSRNHSGKQAARDHIGRCWLNPAVKACKTCGHFTDEPGSGTQCIPGRNCGCDQGFQQCEAGVQDVADGRIVSGCPLWKAKESIDA